MIDLQFLREEPNKVLDLIARKDPAFNGKALIDLDESVRSLQSKLDGLRALKNDLAKQGKQGVTQELREQSIQIGKDIKEREMQLEAAQLEFNNLVLRCPNIVMEDVPLGNKESNRVVKIVGDKPQFNFPLKHHLDLGTQLGWLDFEAAAKMSGSQFALYKNEGVRLVYALMMFMMNNNMRFGYSPVLPPYLVQEDALVGAGNFPRFKDEVYAMPADNLYLTPTSEVNLSAIYRNTILSVEELPIRMTSWTSCFRREAGGYGASERGLIRIHQFEKVEIYAITTPEESSHEQDRMIACAESILQALNLHYRISLLAAQDCSFSSAKTYDIEVWMPGQKEYKEVSSASNCATFQARRSGIRYRVQNGAKTQYVHTLNASSLALPRLMVALMETYQQADGTIQIPDVLKSVTITL